MLQGEVLQVVRQGAGWQQGGLQQGACTEMGWQQVEAQQQGLQTTAVQEVGQQVMGRQQPCCRLQGSQQMGRRQGSQMGLVKWGKQVTGRHTVVWQDTGRQQQGSRQQQGWQQPPQLWEEKEPQQDMVGVWAGVGLRSGKQMGVLRCDVSSGSGPFIYLASADDPSYLSFD